MWEVILWFLYFIINMALIASNLYQIVCLTDLESDHMNPYESSSSINAVVIPEMVLHVLCSVFLLVTGYWFMFLLTLPIAVYNLMLYTNRKHLIDVTEIFRYVNAEKKYRFIKLLVYSFLFILIVIRSLVAGKFTNVLEPFHPANEDLNILSHVLEF
ncbi:protein cornichon homolog 1-like [Rutidosis leptorrhynchoides]|uniref:protein cornichon homolog 1-like n=1 Tax=Rutidosis leptorrhynchoides TaxID=125765 RepID=UPI003A9933EB